MPAGASAPTVAGIPISHPERLIYPDLGITKLDLARYYERIEEWIVPHVKGRPLTLVHCPAGLAAPCLFLKHAKQWGPGALRRVTIQEKTKIGEYLVADTIQAVVALAQMGIVEIHTWNSTMVDVERPNRLVWDLDPGPNIAWKQIVQGALLVRDVLQTLGLTSWVKTTGGKGLHVIAPIRRTRDWSGCLEFARDVSEAIVRTDPIYTTTYAKAGRDRRILIDYLRNNRTNTSISAYSPRARPGAPVSMPLDWAELDGGPERWTLVTVPQRLKRLRKDPWRGYWTTSQQLTSAAINALRRL
jgi:bifunctional non-homologous end joining protein LigD